MAKPVAVSIAAVMLTSVLIWTGDWSCQLTKPLSADAGPACADSGPTITAVPAIVYVGDNFPIIGSGFTPGSVINFFVATSSSVINYGPTYSNQYPAQ